jgi:5-methylthioadenosine/S-adenosylhomocysteine deaminase
MPQCSTRMVDALRLRAHNAVSLMKLGPPLLLALLVCVPTSAFATTSIAKGSDLTKYVLRGKIVTAAGTVLDGELVIERDTITCVAADCVDPPGASILTITNAFIYAGFVDAHNHVAYNVLPKWTPPRLYLNRGQWQSAKAYTEFKKPYALLKDTLKLFCEMVKWGELKALISGITSIQGTAPNQACFRTLIRNVENQSELGTTGAHIRTFILDISSFRATVNWDVTKSFVVHLAEGVDERSRNEFQTLKQKGLLRAETAIIHGTAFGDAEFAEMGKVGAKLVWSPQSNQALYGTTTDIGLALKHGVSISLGVDWNPSGSDDVFNELRTAAELNEERFGSVVGPQDWLPMITTNPAKALALDTRIGQLAASFKADITVLRTRGTDPHASLLTTQLQDVEMVWVGGELLYGRSTVLQMLKPGLCDRITVRGASQRICVADTTNPVTGSNQTLSAIRDKLQAAYPQLSPLVP